MAAVRGSIYISFRISFGRENKIKKYTSGQWWKYAYEYKKYRAPLSASIDEATADIIKTAPGLLQKASRCSPYLWIWLFLHIGPILFWLHRGYPDNILMGNSTINRKETPKSEKATLSKMAGFSEKSKDSHEDMTINGKREGTMVFIHRLSPSRAADDILSL